MTQLGLMFLKSNFLLTTCITLLFSWSAAQASVTLWSNDFEAGSSQVWVPITTQNSVSIVDDPTGSANQVLRVWDEGTAASTTEWGEIRPGTVTYFPLQPFNVKAGIDTATLSLRLYIPNDSVSTSSDRINIMLRYSNVSTPGTGQFVTNNKVVQFSTLARDQWHEIVLQDAPILSFGVPEGGTEATSLYITPVISIADYVTLNSSGVFAYVDDMKLTATPEPSRALMVFCALLISLFRRRR